jgi:hypothetical protein
VDFVHFDADMDAVADRVLNRCAELQLEGNIR